MKIGTSLSPLLLVSRRDRRCALIVLYRFTALGRQILAAGANPRAAAMSGVPVGPGDRHQPHALGPAGGGAGLMVVFRLGAAVPSVGGDEWLLPSFLGPVLGGTLLSGGAVAVVGTMIGAALVTTIRSGLLVLQVGNFWLQLFLGADPAPRGDAGPLPRRLCRAPAAEATMTSVRRFAIVGVVGPCGGHRARRRGARRSSHRTSSPSSTSTSCCAASASDCWSASRRW